MKIGKIRGFDIMASAHAQERFKERRIREMSPLKSLIKKNFEKYASGLNIMIIDERQGLTTICDVRQGVVVIVTVLDKVDVFVKKNTIVERIV